MLSVSIPPKDEPENESNACVPRAQIEKNRRTFLVSSSLYTSMINGGTAANVLEND